MKTIYLSRTVVLLCFLLASCTSTQISPQTTVMPTEMPTLETVQTATIDPGSAQVTYQEQVINAWYARDAQAFRTFYIGEVMVMGTTSPLNMLDSADKLVDSVGQLIPDAPAGTPAAITNPQDILAQTNYDPRKALSDGEFALVGADRDAKNWVILIFKPSDQLFGILLVPFNYQPQSASGDLGTTYQEQVINAWYARDAQAFRTFYIGEVMVMGTTSPLNMLDSADKLVDSVGQLIPDAPAGTPAAITNPQDILAQTNYDPRKALSDGEFALVGADRDAKNWVILIFKPSDQLFGILLVPMDFQG